MSRILKRLTQAGGIASATYIAGIWYATDHPEFQKYVPYSSVVIDYLEERKHQSRVSTRAIKSHESQNLNQDFYYKRVDPELSQSIFGSSNSSSSSSAHPASSVTSAKLPTSNASSLTSRLEDEISDEEKKKKGSQSSSATSALSSKDPLAPERFFDSGSGTVGKKRAYLPLVLLPDHSDKQINKVAMSLNELITSINSSVVTEETVLNVKKRLEELANSRAGDRPHYANEILVKSHNFDTLYRSFKLLWDEYLDAQGLENTSPDNTVIAQYTKKLAKEVADTELLLVKLVNSNTDLEYTEEQKIAEHHHSPYYHSHRIRPRSKDSESFDTDSQKDAKPASSSSDSQSTYSTKPFLSESLDTQSFGGVDSSDISIKLELALTLLVTALQEKSSVPLGPYIEGVREALEKPFTSKYTTPSSREHFISEVLKTVSVSSDVDLKPVLNDILESYDDEHKH